MPPDGVAHARAVRPHVVVRARIADPLSLWGVTAVVVRGGVGLPMDRSLPSTFPRIEVRDLEGRATQLPDAVPGPADVVVLAFRRGQQADVDAWRDAVAGLGNDGVGFWEVPVIGDPWRPLRGWIDGGMARAIPDVEVRTHTLTAYTDTRAVRRALGIPGPGQVAAVLVAGGMVAWTAFGPVTADAVTGLRDAVARLRGDA